MYTNYNSKHFRLNSVVCLWGSSSITTNKIKFHVLYCNCIISYIMPSHICYSWQCFLKLVQCICLSFLLLISPYSLYMPCHQSKPFPSSKAAVISFTTSHIYTLYNVINPTHFCHPQQLCLSSHHIYDMSCMSSIQLICAIHGSHVFHHITYMTCHQCNSFVPSMTVISFMTAMDGTN